MKSLKLITSALIVISLSSSLFSQNKGKKKDSESGSSGDSSSAEQASSDSAAPSESGAGESVAEAAITGAASQPQAESAGSTESNPVVTIVRAGLPLSTAATLDVSKIVKIAKASSSLANFDGAIAQVKAGKLTTTELDSIADSSLKASASSSGFSAAVTAVAEDKISTEQLDDIADSSVKGSFTDAGFAIAVNGVADGKLTTTQLDNIALATGSDASALEDTVEGIASGRVTDDDLTNLSNSEFADTKAIYLEQSTNVLLASSAANIELGISDTTYKSSARGYLESAVTLADQLLQDVVLSSDLPTTDITLSNINSADSGYTLELVRLLDKYGAFGKNGNALASSVLGSSFSTEATGTISVSNDSTNDYLTYLSTLTGKSSTFHDHLSGKSVIDVPLSNVKLAPANTYVLGVAGKTSNIDVNSKLPEVEDTDFDISPSDENIYILGAAKDITTAGAVVFDNKNDAEDHALVIGAADQVIVSKSITYKGSNLAIGQGGVTTDTTKESVINQDRALLIAADISTGGNLAIGSLGQLQISGANFTLGTANETSEGSGVWTSDEDNLYLYANDLIEIKSLTFNNARLDDVYMEAITINLKDITFPSTSDVFLRTRDGTIAFETFSSPTVGAANFTNVIHPDVSSTKLTEEHFDRVGDKYVTSHNAVSVGKF